MIKRSTVHIKEEWANSLRDFILEYSFSSDIVEIFEQKICSYLGCKYALAVNSATSGILLSLLCLTKESDEVIIPNYAHPAAYNCCIFAKTIPIPVDMKMSTLAMDPRTIKNAITDWTKAVIHVETNGWISNDIEKIRDICKESNLLFIEDSAPSFGQVFYTPNEEARFKHAGTFGDIGIFSFGQTKKLFSGEGGIIVTDNEELYEKMKLMRNAPDYEIGNKGNFKMAPFLAAFLISQLEDIDDILLDKEKTFKDYFGRANIYYNTSVSNTYGVISYISEKAEEIYEKLKALKIESRYSPYPLIHDDLYISSEIKKCHIDLPAYYNIDSEIIRAVCTTIRLVEEKRK